MLCWRRVSTMMCCSEGFFAKTCQGSVSNGGPCCAGAGFCTADTWLSRQGDLSSVWQYFLHCRSNYRGVCRDSFHLWHVLLLTRQTRFVRENKTLLSSAPTPGRKYLSRAALRSFFNSCNKGRLTSCLTLPSAFPPIPTTYII